MSTQDDSATFHQIWVTGDTEGRMVVDTELARVFPIHTDREVIGDPRFLGDPPAERPDGSCTYCGLLTHVLYGEPVTARWYHRITAGGGYFSDECLAGAS